jgi:hypothetical protein
MASFFSMAARDAAGKPRSDRLSVTVASIG